MTPKKTRIVLTLSPGKRVGRLHLQLPERLGSRAEFLACQDEIQGLLKQGLTRRSIWTALRSAGQVQSSYATFCRRLQQMQQGRIAGRTAPAPKQLQPRVNDFRNQPEPGLGSSFRPNPTPDIDSLV